MANISEKRQTSSFFSRLKNKVRTLFAKPSVTDVGVSSQSSSDIDRVSLPAVDTTISEVESLQSDESLLSYDSIRINIGIDFGASSTKTAYKLVKGLDLDPSSGRTVWKLIDEIDCIPDQTETRYENVTYSECVVPSVVLIDSDKIWFGRVALRKHVTKSNVLFRQFKMFLSGDSSEISLSSSSTVKTHSKVIAIAYLSFIMSQFIREMRSKYHNPTFTVNVGAPRDRKTTDGYSKIYDELALISWYIACNHSITQGCSLEEFNALYAKYSEQLKNRVEEYSEEYQFRQEVKIVSEYSAACSSLHRYTTPSKAEILGRYFMMIDIGAYTTDFNMFWSWHQEKKEKGITIGIEDSFNSCATSVEFIGFENRRGHDDLTSLANELKLRESNIRYSSALCGEHLLRLKNQGGTDDILIGGGTMDKKFLELVDRQASIQISPENVGCENGNISKKLIEKYLPLLHVAIGLSMPFEIMPQEHEIKKPIKNETEDWRDLPYDLQDAG